MPDEANHLRVNRGGRHYRYFLSDPDWPRYEYEDRGRGWYLKINGRFRKLKKSGLNGKVNKD